MRKVALIFCLAFLFLYTFGQKAEISATAGTGLFSYYGNSALKHRNYYVVYGAISEPPNYPGSIPGLSLFTGINIKKRFQEKLFWGINFQAQRLTSISKIDSIIYSHYDPGPIIATKANGYTSLTGIYAASDLYFGRRIKTRNILIDISGGAEVSLQFSNNEKIKIVGENGDSFNYHSSIYNNHTDIRINIQTEFIYKKLSLNLGYFRGILNYFNTGSSDDSKNFKAYSSFFQIEFEYKIK